MIPLLAVLLGATLAPAQEPSPGDYEMLLARYRAGARLESIAALVSWGRADAQETLRLEPADALAAVVLHTEAAFASVRETAAWRPIAWKSSGDVRATADHRTPGISIHTTLPRTLHPDAAYHLDIAEKLLARKVGRGPEGEALMKEWSLAVGFGLQSFGAPLIDHTHHYLARALKRDKRDPALLLAMGSVYEMGSLMRVSLARDGYLRPSQRRESMARQAEKYYRRALKEDGVLAEARLRLGRLLSRRGKRKDAERELEWVIENAQQPHLLALGHLFLGQLRETTGRWREALEHFQAAVDTAPQSRTCRLAQAFTLHQMDRRAEARAAVRLAAGNAGTGLDLWVAYGLGSWNVGPAGAALLERVEP